MALARARQLRRSLDQEPAQVQGKRNGLHGLTVRPRPCEDHDRVDGWFAKSVLAALLLALAASGVAVARGSNGPSAVASGQKTYAKFSSGRQYRPGTFRFGMSGQVNSMGWAKWGKKIARGTGTYQFNDCIPYCAAGTITPTPASVVLTGRESCGGRFIFRHMKIYYAGRKTTSPAFCK